MPKFTKYDQVTELTGAEIFPVSQSGKSMNAAVSQIISMIPSPLLFKGGIAAAADFPALADVETGWMYKITADVTDDDVTKTNTGESFFSGAEIAWDGSAWLDFGSENEYIKKAEFTSADEIMVGTGSGTHGQITLDASEILGKAATGAAKNLSAAEVRTILNVEDGAEANNISDIDATDLTDGGDTTLHDHDGISENTAARHSQNTDTGTTSGTFQIDSGNTGPKIKNNALVLETRNAADDAYADLKVKDVTIDGQVASLPIFTDASKKLETKTLSDAFTAIKQPATTDATGVVELATDAEVRLETADKFPDASQLPLSTRKVGPAAVAGIGTISTSGSSTTVTLSNADDYAAIQPGSTIIANSLTRYVVTKDGANAVTINTATDFSTGYSFTYQNPITLFEASDGTIAGWIRADGVLYNAGKVGVGEVVPTENLTVKNSIKSISGNIYIGANRYLMNTPGVGYIPRIGATYSSALNTVDNLYLNIDSNNSSVYSALIIANNAQDALGNELFRFQEDGNFGSTSSFGTSAAGILGMAIGTEPESAPPDICQMGVSDYAAGDARWWFMGEASTDKVWIGDGSIVIPSGVGKGYWFGNGANGITDDGGGNNYLYVYLNGSKHWIFATTYIKSNISGGARISSSVPTSTVPAYNFDADTDTGIGKAAADQLSLIAGGVEGIRVIEDAGAIEAYTMGASGVRVNDTSGGFKAKPYFGSVEVTAAATLTITLNIPTGAKLKGCQLHVPTALAAGETWDAEFNDGAQVEAIGAAIAVAQNTNVNFFSAGVETDATTNIVITKTGGGAFTAQGEIEAVAYVEEFTAWTDEA